MSTLKINPSYTIDSYKLNYRACIPFYILLDKDLSKTDLQIYGLVEQMQSMKGTVFYSNNWMASTLGIAVRNIQLAKKRLKEKGYLVCEFKEIKIRNKKVWRHCWNTAVPEFITEMNAEPQDLEIDLPPDADDHPPGDIDDHPPGDVDDHPCNTSDLRSQELSVVKPHTFDFLPKGFLAKQNYLNTTCLASEKCQREFKKKFGKLDLTIQELLKDCVMYYALLEKPANVGELKFYKWIKMERVELYDKKTDCEANAVWSQLSKEDQDLIQEFKYRLKNPDLCEDWKPLTRQESQRAQTLLDHLTAAAKMKKTG